MAAGKGSGRGYADETKISKRIFIGRRNEVIKDRKYLINNSFIFIFLLTLAVNGFNILLTVKAVRKIKREVNRMTKLEAQGKALEMVCALALTTANFSLYHNDGRNWEVSTYGKGSAETALTATTEKPSSVLYISQGKSSAFIALYWTFEYDVETTTDESAATVDKNETREVCRICGLIDGRHSSDCEDDTETI
jgi:hypothetical protein